MLLPDCHRLSASEDASCPPMTTSRADQQLRALVQVLARNAAQETLATDPSASSSTESNV